LFALEVAAGTRIELCQQAQHLLLLSLLFVVVARISVAVACVRLDALLAEAEALFAWGVIQESSSQLCLRTRSEEALLRRIAA
tara:strand:+ start:1033 stop:1281 length:249 start_codon:yes stop_codon:yes gene_type:complete